MPATNHHENLVFALAWVQTASDPTIEFKLPSPHWDLVECRIRDEENNSFPLSRTVHLSQSVQTGFDYSLESNKTWRVDATFVGAREFHRPDPADFTDDEKRILEISFTGPEVRLTNSIGEIYIWRFDGHELSTRREKGIDRPYWIVLSTTNELKKSITWSGGSAWSGPFRGVQSQIWWMDNPVTSSISLSTLPLRKSSGRLSILSRRRNVQLLETASPSHSPLTFKIESAARVR